MYSFVECDYPFDKALIKFPLYKCEAMCKGTDVIAFIGWKTSNEPHVEFSDYATARERVEGSIAFFKRMYETCLVVYCSIEDKKFFDVLTKYTRLQHMCFDGKQHMYLLGE